MKKLILIVTFFIFYTAQNGAADNNTIWKKAESVNDFAGKWEGNNNINIPENTANAIPESSIEVGIFFEYIKGSDEVNANMKVNLDRFLIDWLNVPEIKGSGFTKDNLWEILINEFENNIIDDKFSIGDEYYLNYDLSENADVFFFDNTDGDIFLNETGNQVKIVFNKPFSFGLGDEGFTEIILNKK
ncbi:MAG: hypothetical protein LBC76_05835 [Treponema sp.]|jgi:hypothetical protein|nr:hypothetical protein [Treponema sp.]